MIQNNRVTGESRHGTAPAKPQRVSSMRDRSRQSTVTIPNTEENVVSNSN